MDTHNKTPKSFVSHKSTFMSFNHPSKGTQLLQMLSNEMKVDRDSVPNGVPATLVHRLFGIKLQSTLKCTEAEDETPEVKDEVISADYFRPVYQSNVFLSDCSQIRCSY